MDKSSHKYKNIAFLFDHIDTYYQRAIFEGVKDAAFKKGWNLLCFEGASLDSPLPFEDYYNRIYEYSFDERFDGYLLITPTLCYYVDKEATLDFINRFKSRPLVSIGSVVDGVHSIMEDNKSGFIELVEHLCIHHGFRRIAFIKGQAGIQATAERFDVFKATLEKCGVPFYEELVVEGNFFFESGEEGVRILMDERKAEFDAIVASNDYTALGAVNALRKRGIMVPFDKAVTGFDDMDLARASHPALTTVKQPLLEIGSRAVDMLDELLTNKQVPLKTLMPAKMIIRDSCGFMCAASAYNEKAKLENIKKATLSDLRSFTGHFRITHNDKLVGLLNNLPDHLLNAVADKDEKPMMNVLVEYLNRPNLEDSDLFTLSDWLKELRSWLLSGCRDLKTYAFVETLFFKLILLVHQKQIQSERHFMDYHLNYQSQFSDIQGELLRELNLESQIKLLGSSLHILGIHTSLFCLYDKKSDDKAFRLISAVKNEKAVDHDSVKSYNRLMPVMEKILTDDKDPYFLMVQPLQEIGFAVINFVPKVANNFYIMFRDMIAVPLKCALLFEEIGRQKDNLEDNLVIIRKAMSGFIETMAYTIEVRDPYTAGHQRRVSVLSRAIAQEMGCSNAEIECVRVAGIIHDVGKISVPSEILNKPGKLNEAEFTLIKHHPQVAYDILVKIDFPWPIADIVYQHHERLDGTGYPLLLKADAIRKEARILAVADVVEAMASHRPYRPALGIDAALKEIREKRGINYDSEVVDACLRLFLEKNYEL
ncbi:MAG: substrate-binding domain-containing protein [Spirochaetales bacterium]|nr:substrate-binding domain-containing protein [Spirochaetales bacterium]